MSTRRIALPLLAASILGCAGASQHASSSAQARVDAPGADAAPQPVEPAAAADPSRDELAVIAVDSITTPNACDRGTCQIAGLGPSDPRSIVADVPTEAPHAVAWLERIAPGAQVRFPRRGGVDLLGLVVAGEASLGLEEQPASAARHAVAWTAFLLPAGGASIRAVGSAPVVLLLLGAGEPMRARATIGDASGPRAPGDAFVLRPVASRDALAVANRAGDTTRHVFSAADSPSASLDVLTVRAHGPVDLTSRPDAWELLVVLSGEGSLGLAPGRLPGPHGDTAAHSFELRAGTTLFIPPGVAHRLTAQGTAPLVAAQIVTPPLAEPRSGAR